MAYVPEVRERAVRMAREHEAANGSQWSAIRSVAEKLGCTAEPLRRWVRQTERDAGVRPGLTADERLRLKERERDAARPLRPLEAAASRAMVAPREASTSVHQEAHMQRNVLFKGKRD